MDVLAPPAPLTLEQVMDLVERDFPDWGLRTTRMDGERFRRTTDRGRKDGRGTLCRWGATLASPGARMAPVGLPGGRKTFEWTNGRGYSGGGDTLAEALARVYARAIEGEQELTCVVPLHRV